jgi:hypothetical protein
MYFVIGETCCHYQLTLSDENAEIAHWVIQLSHN